MRNLIIIPVFMIAGCVSNTNISYFPDQRGPFYCQLGDSQGTDIYRNSDFEVLTLQNSPNAFALRKESTNEIVVLANSMHVISAKANPIYEHQWWGKKIVAVKLLVVVGIKSDPKLLDAVRSELSPKFPGAVYSESLAKDIFIDIYSIWLGSEYTRTPCDGVALDNIPFEITLPGEDGTNFLSANGEALQLAGRVLYRDAKSGWRFHRSFSLQRKEFTVADQYSK